MSVDIYDKFRSAFGDVTAAAILHNGDNIGRVCIKSKTAYCHFLGQRMVRGTVTGGGYNLQNAACAKAAQHAFDASVKDERTMGDIERAFWAALIKDGGEGWDRALRDNGFTVVYAI